MPQKKKESFTHKLGDAVEELGRKLQRAGASKVGRATYATGNKIEHARDSKKSRQ